MGTIRIKRIYEKTAPEDGCRILVDRLWPRGVKKEDARLDLWLKDAAPSTELRKWFNHESPKWADFQKRYRAELKKVDPATFEPLLERLEKGERITFLIAAADVEQNHAIVLREWVARMSERRG